MNPPQRENENVYFTFCTSWTVARRHRFYLISIICRIFYRRRGGTFPPPLPWSTLSIIMNVRRSFSDSPSLPARCQFPTIYMKCSQQSLNDCSVNFSAHSSNVRRRGAQSRLPLLVGCAILFFYFLLEVYNTRLYFLANKWSFNNQKYLLFNPSFSKTQD